MEKSFEYKETTRGRLRRLAIEEVKVDIDV